MSHRYPSKLYWISFRLEKLILLAYKKQQKYYTFTQNLFGPVLTVLISATLAVQPGERPCPSFVNVHNQGLVRESRRGAAALPPPPPPPYIPSPLLSQRACGLATAAGQLGPARFVSARFVLAGPQTQWPTLSGGEEGNRGRCGCNLPRPQRTSTTLRDQCATAIDRVDFLTFQSTVQHSRLLSLFCLRWVLLLLFCVSPSYPRFSLWPTLLLLFCVKTGFSPIFRSVLH